MIEMNRRRFLELSVLASTGTLLGESLGPAGEKAAGDPAPCAPEAWEKHGVVLEASEAWEGESVQNFTAPAEPIDNGAWRIWYSVSDRRAGYALAYAEGVPGEPFRKTRAECSPTEPANAPFSIGNLPAGWKPVQGIHIRLRNGIHRIYFWAHGRGICRYLAAESDDGKRYRVLDPLRPVLYHPSDRAAHGVPSPDGQIGPQAKSKERPPTEPLAPSHLISNDATTIYQLADGSFEIYSVALVKVPIGDPAYVAEDNAPGLVRVIDHYSSGDGLHFENRRRVIQRDTEDPPDQQFYYLSVTQTPRGRVGLLGHYRCRAQTMDLEWCFSRDGVAWHRPRRAAWIVRDKPPSPDCFGIYAGNQLVHRDGRWHLFYTGVNSSHNGKQSYGPERQVIMHASTGNIWA